MTSHTDGATSRILLVRPPLIGGVQRQTKLLAEELSALPRLTGEPRPRYQPPYPDPVSAAQLRRVIRSLRPDIVHSSGWFSYSTGGGAAREQHPARRLPA